MKNQNSVKLPLYKSDNKASKDCIFSNTQKDAIRVVKKKISTGEYKFQNLQCICGSNDEETVLTEKDRYGFDYKCVVCPTCGIVRPVSYLSEESLIEFYKKEYRDIYIWSKSSRDKQIANLFVEQKKRGELFLSIIKNVGISLDYIEDVFEIGCASGGVLFPFKNLEKNTIGCDYEREYMDYGISKGIDIREGDISEVGIDDSSQDLIILSHVFEHFVNPIEELNKIVKKLRSDKYLIVEVPSISSLELTYENPLLYFQNAHVYNFTLNNLRNLFEEFGLEVIYSDQKSIFILKKGADWEEYRKDTIELSSLINEKEFVINKFKQTYLSWITVVNMTKNNDNLRKDVEDLRQKIISREEHHTKRINTLERRITTLKKKKTDLEECFDRLSQEHGVILKENRKLRNSNWYKLSNYLSKSIVYNKIRTILVKIKNIF
jgi:SAM-dependent methyltransferase